MKGSFYLSALTMVISIAAGIAVGIGTVIGASILGGLIVPIAIASVVVLWILVRSFSNPHRGLLWASVLSVCGTISLFSFAGASIKPYQVIFMIALAGTITALSMRKRVFKPLPTAACLPVLCFFMSAFFSVVVAKSVILAAKQLLLLSVCILLFLAVAAVSDFLFFKRLVRLLVLVAIPICLIGIGQMVGMAYIGMKLHYFSMAFMRAYSVFEEANEFSQYLVFVFPFILCGLYARSREWATMHWVALLLTLACLLFSMSRGGWLGAGLSAIVILAGIGAAEGRPDWHSIHRINAVIVSLGVVVVIVGFAASLVTPEVLSKRATSLFSGSDPTTAIRYEQDVLALNLMLANPLTGVGIGNIGFALGSDVGQGGALRMLVATSSNMFMDIGAETGIPGLLFFAIFVASIVAIGVGGIRRNGDPNRKILTLASLASFVGLVANGLSYAAHLIPFIWVSAAIVVGTSRCETKDEPAGVSDVEETKSA